MGAPGGLWLVVVLRDVDFVGVCVCCRCGLLWRIYIERLIMLLVTLTKGYGGLRCLPFGIPPPNPVILFNLADPPALILASRRSLRMRACSAALEGGELALLGEEDGTGVVSAISMFLCRWLVCESVLDR